MWKTKMIMLFIMNTVLTASLMYMYLKNSNDCSQQTISKSSQQINFYEYFKSRQVVKADEKVSMSTVESHPATKTLNPQQLEQLEQRDVCPEIHNISDKEQIEYIDRFKSKADCNNSKPFENVLSIILLANKMNTFIRESLPTVIKGIKTTYPNITLFVVYSELSVKSILIIEIKKYLHIKLIEAPSSFSDGKILNKVVTLIPTKYVLVAKELYHFNWLANLERIVRVLYEHKNVTVAGGSIRNETAYWKMGCYQTETTMHMLRYIQGYYESNNDCVFCDMIIGPFASKTQFLKTQPFTETLKGEMIFKDWFLRLKSKGHQVMNCPDVMYFVSEENLFKTSLDRSAWLPLANNWTFDYVIPERDIVHKFNCQEIQYECKMMNTKSFMLPTCCFDDFSRALKFWVKFVEKYNISYEIDSGSVLGAVKLSDMMPWDLDGDIKLPLDAFFKIFKHQDEFKAAGIKIYGWKLPSAEGSRGYFKFNEPLYFEVFSGSLSMNRHLPEELLGNPTKLLVHGIAVNAPTNPALYARNRYGPEIYKHSQSWIISDSSNSHVPYKSGRFSKCTNPGHPSCLDNHPTDGNIPFRIFL